MKKGRQSIGSLFIWTPIGLVLLAIAGCGSKSDALAVSGAVTFDGEPIDNGEIVFTPAAAGGRQATAPIVGGKYTIDQRFGAKPGAYNVEIRAYRETKSSGPGNPYATDAVPREQFIPREFNDQSTLTTDISSDNVEHDFNLSSTE